MEFSPLGGNAGDDIIAYSKMTTPTLYQCLIVTIRLSCTVSDIIKFFVNVHVNFDVRCRVYD